MRSVRFISSESIKACPWFILMPEHYRDNGKCRCDDPTHTEMEEWGYTWNDFEGRWDGHDYDAA